MIVAAWVVLAVAWIGAARIARARRHAPLLPLPAPDPPRTAILLPVRDEEANAAACVASLLAQSAAARLRVIDDGSTDATPEILRALAREHPELEVVVAPPPPAGWNGKIHALAVGAAGLDEPWILATDADTRHAPDLLARAHAAAAEHGLDALSLAGTQRADSLGEGLLTPPVFAWLDARFGDWHAAARGEGPAVANGQFLLVRRGALERAGGYAAVAGEPLDDVALARRLRAAGARTGFRRAGEGLEVRMYAGAIATFRGWRRNLGLLAAGHAAALLAGIAFAVLPCLVLALALFVRDPAAAFVAWCGGAGASALLRPARGGMPGLALLYPLDALAFAACAGLALLDQARGRRPSWRGRPLARGTAEPPR